MVGYWRCNRLHFHAKPALNYAYRSLLYTKSVHLTKAIMKYFNLCIQSSGSFLHIWNIAFAFQWGMKNKRTQPSVFHLNVLNHFFIPLSLPLRDCTIEPFQGGNYWKFCWGLILSLSCLLLKLYFFFLSAIAFLHSLNNRVFFWVQVNVFSSPIQNHKVYHP